MNIASSDVYTTTLSDVHGTKVRLADVHRDGAVILSLSSRDAAADAEAFGKADCRGDLSVAPVTAEST